MDHPFQPGGHAPEISFRTRDVNPPSPLYVTREDVLVILTAGSTPTSFNIRGRLMLSTGAIVPFVHTITPSAGRVLQTLSFAMSEGFLLSIVAENIVSGPRPGERWVLIGLNRGDPGIAGLLDHILASGYFSSIGGVGWPGGEILDQMTQPGNPRVIVGTDPAAGAEVSETVPSGAVWRLKSLFLSFTTNATVANREVVLLIDDGANIYAVVPPPALQAASLSRNYDYAIGVNYLAGLGSNHALPLPAGILLSVNHRFRTATVNIQAGDNYAAPIYQVEEWILP